MKSKKLIAMIIFVLGFMGGQLIAAEIVGYSIYPNIENPHPYSKAHKDTGVWSETICQSGAAWLKVHFSNFHLKDDEYVDLIDKNGFVMVRIKGIDVADEKKSRFKVIKNDHKKVSFWGPSIAGDVLRIELHMEKDTRKGWGFTIDEVGVGIKPFPEDELAWIECVCGTDDRENIVCYSGQGEYFARGQAVGRMLYQKNGYWYKGNGFLCACDYRSTFLTHSSLIDSQSVVNTLEVQFEYQYPYCNGTGRISSYTHSGDQYIWSDSTKKYCVLTLKDSPQDYYQSLEPLNREPEVNEDIYLIQHPSGDPKQIGFGVVSNTTGYGGLSFYHYIDTDSNGTWGAPILVDDSSNMDKVLGFDDDGNCPNKAVKMTAIYSEVKHYLGCN
ncbi:MAG: trypsin-like peptidase domain-containing protein [Candidatus Aminicenantes bacterium]|nr:MAG: trypsin-like peptidase domain-containing protein [Candidatus Aminicenantes bacterium]